MNWCRLRVRCGYGSNRSVGPTFKRIHHIRDGKTVEEVEGGGEGGEGRVL